MEIPGRKEFQPVWEEEKVWGEKTARTFSPQSASYKQVTYTFRHIDAGSHLTTATCCGLVSGAKAFLALN